MNPGEGRDFPHPSRLALGPTQPHALYNGHRIIPVGKAAGPWRSPRTTSSAEVKERVYQHIYSSYGPSEQVTECNLLLPFFNHYSTGGSVNMVISGTNKYD